MGARVFIAGVELKECPVEDLTFGDGELRPVPNLVCAPPMKWTRKGPPEIGSEYRFSRNGSPFAWFKFAGVAADGSWVWTWLRDCDQPTPSSHPERT